MGGDKNLEKQRGCRKAVLQTLVPNGQPMRETNCCVMMLFMMLLLLLLLFFALAVAVAGVFLVLLSFLWGRL